MVSFEPILAGGFLSGLGLGLAGQLLWVRGSRRGWRLSRDPGERMRDDRAARRLLRAGSVLDLAGLAVWGLCFAFLVGCLWMHT